MEHVSDVSKIRIEVGSHHFTVYRTDPRLEFACYNLTKGLVEWDFVRIPGPGRARFENRPIRTFASASPHRREVRYAITLLDDFRHSLTAAGIKDTEVEYHYLPMYEPAALDLPWVSTKIPRELQVPLIDYLSQPIGVGPNARVITAQTGAGKSTMACCSIRSLNLRTAIVIKAEYLEMWEEVIQDHFDVGKEGLLIIRGAKALVSLMNLAIAGELTAGIILISNKTFQLYLKAYETQPDFSEMYPIHPVHFYEVLKVGLRLIDEVHLDFHLNFKQNTYTHIPITTSLSATLDADRELLNRMYRILWPIATRGPEMPYRKYILTTCLWYRADKPDRIRHKNAKKQYAHIEFENSILRNKQLLANYLKIPELVMRTKVVPNLVKGQKVLIFCSTIAMCTAFVEHLRKLFPQYSVARYVGEDEWEQLHNNDVVVSTIQSAGTAVDIVNLRYTLMTVSLSNKQTNIQVLGRLRELVNFEGTDPEFMFVACQNIAKQAEYAHAKRAKLDGKVKSYTQAYLPVTL